MNGANLLRTAIEKALADLALPVPERLVIEEPKDSSHGDLSTNAAMLLAKVAKSPPTVIAKEIAASLLKDPGLVKSAEVAGPGFINITLNPEIWRQTIQEVESSRGSYGHSRADAGEKALVEYVSANPTGPLHIGHGRGAAVGDSVYRILKAAGYDVHTEYYLNDAGRQMRLLGLSIYLRAKELADGKTRICDDCYKGEYIIDLARDVLAANPGLLEMPEAEACAICQKYGQDVILDGIRKTLDRFGCSHEAYFSEKSLVDNGSVTEAFKKLASSGRSYEADGALWFDSKSLGDDQNRVLRKSDGSLTYFATDIAYHHDKFERGYKWLIDVWGADHHGYIPRMKAAVADMGENPEKFSVLLIQLVNLFENGEAISMSTRGGEFVELDQLLDEVGTDAARFMFLFRSPDTPLDFDLEVAKSRSLENPVYYVQYAHARVCALERRAEEKGIILPDASLPEEIALLDTPEDLALLRKISFFAEIVANSAKMLAPQYISRYLMELASRMHAYYGKYTIIDLNNPERTRARLGLLRAAAQTIANGLELLGVSAPEIM